MSETHPDRHEEHAGVGLVIAQFMVTGVLLGLVATLAYLGRIGPGTQLPDIYRNIQGAHYSYMWRNGEFIAEIRGGRRVFKRLIYPA